MHAPPTAGHGFRPSTAEEPPPRVSPLSTRAPERLMQKALILVIDPSSDTRAMYGDYFRHHGYAVAEAADGAEGVRLFEQLRPDLIVTELSAEPEWLRSIQRIRGQGDGPRTAMIACSTTIDATWPAVPHDIEVDLALAKPISPRALLQQAELVLDSHASGARAVA